MSWSWSWIGPHRHEAVPGALPAAHRWWLHRPALRQFGQWRPGLYRRDCGTPHPPASSATGGVAAKRDRRSMPTAQAQRAEDRDAQAGSYSSPQLRTLGFEDVVFAPAAAPCPAHAASAGSRAFTRPARQRHRCWHICGVRCSTPAFCTGYWNDGSDVPRPLLIVAFDSPAIAIFAQLCLRAVPSKRAVICAAVCDRGIGGAQSGAGLYLQCDAERSGRNGCA